MMQLELFNIMNCIALFSWHFFKAIFVKLDHASIKADTFLCFTVIVAMYQAIAIINIIT